MCPWSRTSGAASRESDTDGVTLGKVRHAVLSSNGLSSNVPPVALAGVIQRLWG